jgi:hypothetical protein
MSTLDYTFTKPPVHRLPGTPHVRGAKLAVGEMRDGLRKLAAVLVNSGWADEHPLDDDKVALDLIELVTRLGTAEAHALRIAASALMRITKRNGYHVA